jgi:hypothetical protein
MSDFYWPLSGEIGTYEVWLETGESFHWELGGDGLWHAPHVMARTTQRLIEMGYLGVRREPAKPTTEDEEDDARGEREILEAAQQALDEWRSIQHKPAEVERWAYRWAVELCERLGAK